MPKLTLISLTAIALTAAGCDGAGSDASGQIEDGPRTTRSTDRLLVSAAASLTDAFTAIEAAFETIHPGIDVTLNLAGSSTLRAQILEGAPADVFASADRGNMGRVEEAGQLREASRIFALNRLEIAVPPGNPAGVSGLSDFGREELYLGLCAAEVPCGALAREALARAGVAPALDSAEPDVRALLTKIELGELDAGIVYSTDVTAAAGAVEGIDIPEALKVVAEYPIAVLANAPRPELARTFVDFVLGPEGRAILTRHGFRTP